VADEKVFVDTNCFAYALDAGAAGKQSQATELIEDRRRSIVVSTQVLLELFTVCTRELGMTRGEARAAVGAVALFPVVTADRELVLAAAATAERHQLSIFDAAIVEAAARAGCSELFSEDFSEGQVFASLRVRNPF